MKGGETMKKLNKRNNSASNTIEAYSCYCSCSCYCGCNCFCFLGIGSADDNNDTGTQTGIHGGNFNYSVTGAINSNA
jgi:putative bacteriocin precursor